MRRLVDRQKRGLPISLNDAMPLCPFRTVLGITQAGGVIEQPPTVVVACPGFEPEDFSDRMRGDIIAHLMRCESVLLVANTDELRRHAQREVYTAMEAPAGHA